MRRALAVVVAVAVSGCVKPHLPTPQVPTGAGSSDWSAVAAVPKGHFVFVTLDGGELRQGLVWGVTGATLTLYEVGGERTLRRVQIARIAERVPVGTRPPPWVIHVPIVAMVGALAGVIIGAINKTGALKHASWITFALSLGFGIGLEPADRPKPVFEDRLVYVRP